MTISGHLREYYVADACAIDTQTVFLSIGRSIAIDFVIHCFDTFATLAATGIYEKTHSTY